MFVLDIVRKKERKEREKGKEHWGGKGGEWGCERMRKQTRVMFI